LSSGSAASAFSPSAWPSSCHRWKRWRAAGIALQGDLAATELRAFYGGLELALGGLLIAADLGGARRHGLILCLASYGGIGAARVLGIALAGSATPFLWFALGTELSPGDPLGGGFARSSDG
jgi:hypothetical protein